MRRDLASARSSGPSSCTCSNTVFSNSGQQKTQTTALQLDRLLNSGKLLVKLPALADQQAIISFPYMLSGMHHSSEQ